MTAVATTDQEVRRAGTVFAIPLHLIHPDPANPRRKLGNLDDLVGSIREFGILQPLLATRDKTGKIVLTAGERRLAAAEIAGLTHAPVILLADLRPDVRLRMAVIENLHREPMEPMDEARACARLLGMGYSRERIARDLGRSPAWVADRIALLELPAEVQRKVVAGDMPVTAAVSLARQVRRTGSGSVTTGVRCVSHFTKFHPLRESAASMCDAAGHPKAGRTGGVCGACWEASIRADAIANRQ